MKGSAVERICFHKGRIEVLSEAIYEERRQQALQMTADDLAKLEAAGLN